MIKALNRARVIASYFSHHC